MNTTTTQNPRNASDLVPPPPRPSRYGDATSLTMATAFSLSIVHTVYAWREGLEDPSFTVDTPLTWIFYVLGFAMAALARLTSRWTQVIVLSFLVSILSVSIFYYPTTFTAEQQTTFGWFENDVYIGLLGLALFLSVMRLRRRSLVP